MKYFLILFGLATILGSFIGALYCMMYEQGIAFIIKGIISIVIFLLGGYLVYQGILECKK